MKKDLLICIAFHYNPMRVDYLQKVVSSFIQTYECELDIIIDTNADSSYSLDKNVKYCHHKDLSHPFYLTWKHRQHIADNIDSYENFMYVEDDMLIPYENYLNYLENFKLLWPRSVPSFVRIEEANGEQFITDATERQPLNIIYAEGKQFAELKSPYHAFWIMPTKELKESMIDNFVRVHQSRETAASYPMWELNKRPLVEIENGQISKKCYSYHLPNTYAISKESPFAKIKPENLFI